MSDHEEDAPGGQPELRAPSAKLFLGGLSWDTTEEKLRDHFGKYGSIVEAVVMRDRQTGRPRGFGFVTFTTPAAADAVVQDVHVIDGRQIDAKKSVPQELKPKARKVFVGGLSPETTEDQFKDYFSQFGEVVEAQIMQDHMSGRSRGFGFVTFAEDASAEAVFAAGSMHDLGGKRVEVKPATPKGSGSLARPSSSSSAPPRPGAGGAGSRGGMGLPPFGGGPGAVVGSPGALFGSPPSPYAAAGYGMFGFPHAGMVPGGPGFGMQYGGMAQQYGGMSPMAGMAGMAPNPYMMMGGQMGGYVPGAAAYAFPTSTGMAAPAFPPQHPAGGGGGGGHYGGTPFSQQQSQQSQPPYPRPLHMLSRNGSRSKGKVDSASSLEQSEDSAGATQPVRTASGEQGGGTAAVQAQLARATLAD